MHYKTDSDVDRLIRKGAAPVVLADAVVSMLRGVAFTAFIDAHGLGEWLPDGYAAADDTIWQEPDVDAAAAALLRDYLKLYLEMWRQAELAKGVTITSGLKLDCQDKNINDWGNTKLLMDAASMTSVDICDYDNATHTLTAAEYTQLVLEVGAHYQSVYSQKWLRRQQLAAATTVAECLAAVEVSG